MLIHQQCQFQTMLNMMSQPQWSLPAYGPQSVHTIRVHPYESPVPPRPPPVLTLVENTSSAAPPETGLDCSCIRGVLNFSPVKY